MHFHDLGQFFFSNIVYKSLKKNCPNTQIDFGWELNTLEKGPIFQKICSEI